MAKRADRLVRRHGSAQSSSASRACGGGLRGGGDWLGSGRLLVAVDGQAGGVEAKPADAAALRRVLVAEAEIRDVQHAVGWVQSERSRHGPSVQQRPAAA